MDNGTTITEPVVGKTELYDVRIRSQMDSYERKLTKLALVQLRKLKDRIFSDLKWIFDVKKSLIQGDDIYTIFNLDLQELESVLPLAAQFQQELILSTFGGNISNLKAFVGLNFNLQPDPMLFRASLRTRQQYLSQVVTKFTLNRVNKIIEVGVAEGSSYTEMAKRMEDTGLFSRARAERIARTEANRALNEGTRQYVDMLGVTQYKISTARDACEVCVKASKQTYSIQQQDVLPIHTNCRCTLISVIPEDWIRKGFADSATLMKESIQKLEQHAAKQVPLDINLIKQEIRESIKDGKTPTKGVDYYTEEELLDIKQKILSEISIPKDGYTPKKGFDYYTEEEIFDFKRSIQEQIKDLVANIQLPMVKDGVTPKKGVDYFTQEDIDKLVDITTQNVLEHASNSASKISVKDVKGLEKYVKDQISKIQLILSTPVSVSSLNGLSGNVNLVAGSNIELASDPEAKTITISSPGDTTAVWGAITGDLSNQADLQAALDSKPNKIIATKAVILATNPDSGIIAYATDVDRFYVGDGSNWLESATTYTERLQSPDIGVEQNSSLKGYGDNYIANKILSRVKLSSEAEEEEGAIRVVDGEAQIYLDGQWDTFVTGFRFRENEAGAYQLEHQPVGFNTWIIVHSGNSNEMSLSGFPTVQQYQVSMGAYAPLLITISGGQF